MGNSHSRTLDGSENLAGIDCHGKSEGSESEYEDRDDYGENCYGEDGISIKVLKVPEGRREKQKSENHRNCRLSKTFLDAQSSPNRPFRPSTSTTNNLRSHPARSTACDSGTIGYNGIHETTRHVISSADDVPQNANIGRSLHMQTEARLAFKEKQLNEMERLLHNQATLCLKLRGALNERFQSRKKPSVSGRRSGVEGETEEKNSLDTENGFSKIRKTSTKTNDRNCKSSRRPKKDAAKEMKNYLEGEIKNVSRVIALIENNEANVNMKTELESIRGRMTDFAEQIECCESEKSSDNKEAYRKQRWSEKSSEKKEESRKRKLSQEGKRHNYPNKKQKKEEQTMQRKEEQTIDRILEVQ